LGLDEGRSKALWLKTWQLAPGLQVVFKRRKTSKRTARKLATGGWKKKGAGKKNGLIQTTASQVVLDFEGKRER